MEVLCIWSAINSVRLGSSLVCWFDCERQIFKEDDVLDNSSYKPHAYRLLDAERQCAVNYVSEELHLSSPSLHLRHPFTTHHKQPDTD